VRLRYLYVGSADTERDLASWLQLDGAAVRWRFRAFEADVAALAFVDEGTHPAVLLADHRPAGSILPIYEVADPSASADRLVAAGWVIVSGPLGTPEGLATVLRDPSGTELALLDVERPQAMEGAFGDPANEHAVRALARAQGPDEREAGSNPHTGAN
jgi:predicted enzyme related to lactoylglutathione lyase